jgi:hypothetical protein|tara:strand:+ start:20193 stop:21260 length:1068 start_codon:yes stop_codon:yes gene_type:complete
MANQNIRTPRFYVDDVNYQLSRGVTQTENGIANTTDYVYDVMSGSGFIGVQNGTEAELFDMRPLNKVDFNTSADTDGHIGIVIDKGDTSKKYNFVAVLNHNLASAEGAFRIASSDTQGNIITVDHESAAREIEATEVVNAATMGTSDPYLITPSINGSTIVTFGENDDQYFSIQFEGKTASGDGNFSSTDLFIGCIMIGEYYDMPHAPELSVKRSVIFDNNTIQQSIGGQRYSNMSNFGKSASTITRSPFIKTSFPEKMYGGRLRYEMAFNYLASTDIMPTEYTNIQTGDDTVIEDVWNKVNGNHIPFIFSIDNSSTGGGAESEHMFARFAQNSLDMTQVAPDVFNISMRIEEEF